MSAINEWINVYGASVIRVLLAVLLVVLIIMLIKIVKLLTSVNKMMNKVDGSVDVLNDYLNEFKIPVRTIVNVSMSVEALRAASEAQVRAIADSLTANYNRIMELLKGLMAQIKTGETTKISGENTEAVKISTERVKEEDPQNTNEQKGA